MAGYIGSRASVVSSGAERKKTFDITTTTTVLTGLSYTPTFVHLFHNGVRLVDGTDYTATNGTSITLTTAAENGDQVVVVSYATYQVSDTVSASIGGTFNGPVTVDGTLDVTGTVTADGLTVDGAATLSGQLRLNDTNYWINNSGGSDISYRSGGTHKFYSGGFNQRLNIAYNGDISFYEDTGTTPKFFWDASAESLTLSGSGAGGLTLDRGASSNQLKFANAGAALGYIGYSDGNGFAFAGSDGAADVTIAANGNVGIGATTGNDLPLNVKTTYAYNGANNGAIKINNYNSADENTQQQGYIENIGYTGIWHGSRYFGGGNRIMDGSSTASSGISLQGDGSIDFYTRSGVAAGGSYGIAGATRMTIDSSGNLLVGKTVSNSATAGCEQSPNGYQFLTRDGGTAQYIRRNTNNGSVVDFYRAAAVVGSISVTGSATAYNTSSDYRLKENIAPVQGAADIVKAMQPVTYTFKSDGSWHDGFLAHELQELHPRAVVGEKDAMKDEEYEVTPAVEATYDDEGVELTPAVPAVMGTRSVPDYQGVDYSKLTPILTAALQEALNKIDALEARLTALEATP